MLRKTHYFLIGKKNMVKDCELDDFDFKNLLKLTKFGIGIRVVLNQIKTLIYMDRVGKNDLIGRSKVKTRKDQLIYILKYQVPILKKIDPKTGNEPQHGKITGKIRIEFAQDFDFGLIQQFVGIIPKVYKYELSPKEDKIAVAFTISKGHGIPSADIGGLTDSYCQLRLGLNEHKTEVKKNTLFPDWKETFKNSSLTLKELKEIKMTIWDWDRVGKNDLIGIAKVKVNELLKTVLKPNQLIYIVKYRVPIQMKVDPRKGPQPTHGQITGKIRIEIPQGFNYDILSQWSGLTPRIFQHTLPIKENTIAIKFKIKKGFGLPQSDLSGLTDGYCKFRLGQEDNETRIDKGTLYPSWKNTFTSNLTLKELKKIRIQVWDWDKVTAHDFLGIAKVKVNELLKTVLKPNQLIYIVKYRVPIQMKVDPRKGPQPKHGEITGKIRIEIPQGFNYDILSKWSGLTPRQFQHTLPIKENTIAIKFKIKKGFGLPQSDLSGLTDGYCKFRLGQEDNETRIDKGTLYPSWKNTYTSNLTLKELKKIRIQVWDWDKVSAHDFLGIAKVKVNELLKTVLKPNQLIYIVKYRVPIQMKVDPRKGPQPKHGEITGKIRIEIPQGFNYDILSQWSGLTPRQFQHTLPIKENTIAIKFKIKKGFGLPQSDLNGLTDGYCKFRLGQEDNETRIDKGTLYPSWKNTYTSNLTLKELKKIRIQVWDWDKVSAHDFLGIAKVKVNELLKTVLKPNQLIYIVKYRVPIQMKVDPRKGPQPKHGQITGKIRIEIPQGFNYDILSQWSGLTPRQFQHTLPIKENTVAIKFKIKKGFGLPPADKNGLTDGYCEFRLGKEDQQTRVDKSTLYPSWKNTYTSNLTLKELKKIRIQVWDKDKVTTNDFLGIAKVKVNELLKTVLKPNQLIYIVKYRVPIQMKVDPRKGPQPKHGEITGKIRIEIPQGFNYDILSQWSGLTPRQFQHTLPIKENTIAIKFKIKKGFGLPPADKNGLTDGYCEFRLGKEDQQTRVDKSTLYPSWKNTYTSNLTLKELKKIRIQVWDKDKVTTNDFLGIAKVNVNELLKTVLKPNQLIYIVKYRVPIRMKTDPRTGKQITHGEITGKIRIEIPPGFNYDILSQWSGLIPRKFQYTLPIKENTVATKLKIKKGFGLPPADKDGLTDGFCKFKFGQEDQQTRVDKSTLYPNWKNTYTSNLTLNELKKIRIQVWDKDKVSANDFLGMAKVKVRDNLRETLRKYYQTPNQTQPPIFIIHIPNVPIILPINPRTGPRGSHGRISVKLRIEFPINMNPNLISQWSGLTTPIKTPKILGPDASKPVWGVSIKIRKANNVRASDSNNLSDPYCKFVLGTKEFQTTTTHNTLYPVWKEKFREVIDPTTFQKIRVSVMDYDKSSKDDLLGFATFDLKPIVGNKYNQNECVFVERITKPIRYSSKPGKVYPANLGTLEVTIRIEIPIKVYTQQMVNKIVNPFPENEYVILQDPNSNQVGFEVVINKTRDLICQKPDKFANPYCQFQLNNQKLTTNVVKHNNHAKWKSHFRSIGNIDIFRRFTVDVLHQSKKLLSNKVSKTYYLGHFNISVFKLIKESVKQGKMINIIKGMWFNVKSPRDGKTGKVANIGKIHIKLRVELPQTIQMNYVRALCGIEGYAPPAILFNPQNLAQNQWGLRLFIKSGFSLLSLDSNHLSDPYVTTRIGTQDFRTQTIMKTLYPEWRENFDIISDLKDLKKIRLNVIDYDKVSKDDKIGVVTLRLWNLLGKHLKPNQTTYEFKVKEPIIVKSDERFEVNKKHGLLKMIIHIQLPFTAQWDFMSRLCGLSPQIYEPIMKVGIGQWGVKFDIIRGIGIPPADKNGLSDGYIVLKCVTSSFKTKVVSKTLNPIWKDSFEIIDSPQELKKAYLELFDADKMTTDDRIGHITLHLHELFQQHPPPQGYSVSVFKDWYDLYDQQDKKHGKIQIRIRIEVN
ncbi:c2 domain-containing protein [Anaeramoeba ignava]|uniref:C2 domain-containing protein n=1 Tax=Anaeramoeba ignava TaxID=1746090 RepID=A0A9Q0LJ73_ANAIG|nr:c2 domain-containing protein [Anaeramoeba ignava]